MIKKLRQFWAESRGYFWLPCSSCGEMQGGNEWKDVNGHDSTIPATEFSGVGICRKCTAKGLGCRAWYALYGRERSGHHCEFIEVGHDEPLGTNVGGPV
jgi:hypothetical protein